MLEEKINTPCIPQMVSEVKGQYLRTTELKGIFDKLHSVVRKKEEKDAITLRMCKKDINTLMTVLSRYMEHVDKVKKRGGVTRKTVKVRRVVLVDSDE